MKKIGIIMLSLFIFTGVLPVSALTSSSKYQTTQPEKNYLSQGIIEEINVRDTKRVIDYVEAVYTIPENYEGDIRIVSGIFDALAASDGYVPADGVEVRLKIINNSSNVYHYKEDSFILSTEDLEEYELEQVKDAVGFNNEPIYLPFAPNRTGNTALQALYNVTSTAKIKSNMVTDEALSLELQEKGYKDVSELDKYYLDFYNNKYDLTAEVLEDLPYKVIAELFNGNSFSVKETNNIVASLGYDYWYNKLFSFSFLNQDCNDENSEFYSIGSYMRDNQRADFIFNQDFKTINIKEEKDLTPAYLRINGYYTTNAFQNYQFSAYLEFMLVTEKEEIKEEEKDEEEENQNQEVSVIDVDDSIVPPKTGL